MEKLSHCGNKGLGGKKEIINTESHSLPSSDLLLAPVIDPAHPEARDQGTLAHAAHRGHPLRTTAKQRGVEKGSGDKRKMTNADGKMNKCTNKS